ncbi:hypothetical protein BGI40_07345 [Snodgrassella communis]|jgi:hypothetical protein|uniref:Putative lipoprotein n=1 Tax=Snodgrassella communis TaxID=2946699 RepID=A0A066TNK2_9NEIS|nr:GNA1162 family protein [Snodgrassella communis]KDN13514.1 putative lipoprotein [Snodgrassella communis]KDN15807.1 putative lipoprotein [Snodgrassella communis]PIT11293.1 hypothetical protein BGI31_03000 [Snodgrassella communis]PIT11996.1 hypothetical protein BGI29_02845 [Snodgrassella communis]PIT28980.1 hypothetical protein BGI39_04360 [Snodgrassella communis]
MRLLRQLLLPLSVAAILSACSTTSNKQPYDYSKFQRSNPRSILVVQPTSSSVEVKAPNAVMAQSTRPLAESGYYVFPVALVNETFKENGLNEGAEIQAVDLNKIRRVYNPDAILYMDIDDYGTKYQVINSTTTVSVKAKLIDAKTGDVIWTGAKRITVSSSDNKQQGFLGAVTSALITQIKDKVKDSAFDLAGTVNADLLSAGVTNGILYGPHHPSYQKPATATITPVQIHN